MKKCFLVTCFLFASVVHLTAQERNGMYHREIKWEESKEVVFDENEKLKLLQFKGCGYDNEKGFLPLFSETFPLEINNVSKINVELVNEVYQPLKETTLIIKPQYITDSVDISSGLGYEQHKAFVAVSFVPIRRNPVSNTIEKLVAFDLKMIPVEFNAEKNASANRYYAPLSVLSTGTWYKISVRENGIHKIDYNFLKNLGVDMDNVDPRQIKIFGNGGGMLAEANAIPRADDLVENAIEVVGESDGVFNTSDYILFYGQSPDKWYYNTSTGKFSHSKHLYSDFTYYFISIDLAGISKRVQPRVSLTPSGTDVQVSTFDHLDFHELNQRNFIKSGRNFYGEAFDVNPTRIFSFNTPNLSVSDPVYFKAVVLARSFSTSIFNLKQNGQLLCNVSVSATTANVYDDYAVLDSCNGNFFSNGSIAIEITYNPPSSSSAGWLDFIEINARRNLVFSESQMMFRDKNSFGTGNNTSYTIQNFGSANKLWDITDPFNIVEQQVQSNGNFVTDAPVMREFIAFKNQDYLIPQRVGIVVNQNLHASAQTDLIIISHPMFMTEANRLADFHRTHDNMRVIVADVNQVYNEYSSGIRDLVAIRDFVKMFYDRDLNDPPKNLLLFGDGSYDNKSDFESNTNFIPTYQSENSLSVLSSYVSDDFFGFLDSLEGSWPVSGNPHFLDVGVGRLPSKNATEAREMVDKVIRYTLPGTVTDATACTESNSSLGDWRNIICLVSDDEDSSTHLDQTDTLLRNLNPMILKYNLDKIYLDAYQQESTPGGSRYPDVNIAINNRVQKGALLVNYTGHGGELGWAHEKILDNNMISSWKNTNRMPLFLTATCEFSRFDDPGRTSAGEYILLNSQGGGIALYSTTRLVYSFPNAVLNKDMVVHMFQPINNEMPRLGDIFKLSKRDNASAGINPRNFTLLGDPALRLAYPKYDIVATQINNTPLSGTADTIKALSKVTISGEIRNNGQKISSFNGVVYPTVYDKVVIAKTLGNDGGSPLRNFKTQKNILYKGKASVLNGDFSFTFIVPKDISYHYGTGRLSFYAQDGTENDASGYYDSLVIGGFNQTIASDNAGPQIQLYLNSEKFVFGGITNEAPKIFAVVSDSSGINTVGNGIGHDITAIIDSKNDPVYVLNDFYESEIDNFQKGKIIYPLEELSEGRHTLNLKVWDIFNNSSDAYTEFIVAESAAIALEHVLNYPNPFSTKTTFMFEHNQPCDLVDVQVQVYTVSGKLVKTINQKVFCEGFRSDSITWDGRDDFGDLIGRGVYVYRLKVKTNEGATAEKFEKLVLLR